MAQIEVGSTVTIRTWESLVGQYGLDASGYIPINGEVITTMMQSMCGTDVIIESIDDKKWIAKLVNDASFWNWPLEALTLITPAQSERDNTLHVHNDIEEAAKWYNIPLALWDKNDVYIMQEDRCVFVGKPKDAKRWMINNEGKYCKSRFTSDEVKAELTELRDAIRETMLNSQNESVEPYVDQIVDLFAEQLTQQTSQLQQRCAELEKALKKATVCDCGRELGVGYCNICDNDE